MEAVADVEAGELDVGFPQVAAHHRYGKVGVYRGARGPGAEEFDGLEAGLFHEVKGLGQEEVWAD